MKISGLQKVSLVDFDGHISATIFTRGCNFACPYCHNSRLVKGIDDIIPENEVLEYLEKRKNVLDSVVISGGEPTLNPDLPAFIKEIKDMGYKIKLDTNGTNLSMLKNLIENQLIDYVAMDIKNSIEKYNTTTNTNTHWNIKDTIEYIMNCGIDYEFRTTLIKQYHTREDITKIAELIKGAKKLFLQKFVDNENCLQSGLDPIDKDTAEQFASILRKNIYNTYLRGY
ncbi:MAG: anaerobic ribonucleoside-triphosphate reductase activating protein [Clostridia bacterium]|nr:anaerobic ribonucleoside-triphosphate reductase activating protein [Clostridia bacterium]